jgi:hypothetical protein
LGWNVWKISILRQKIIFFPIAEGGPPPNLKSWIRPCMWLLILHCVCGFWFYTVYVAFDSTLCMWLLILHCVCGFSETYCMLFYSMLREITPTDNIENLKLLTTDCMKYLHCMICMFQWNTCTMYGNSSWTFTKWNLIQYHIFFFFVCLVKLIFINGWIQS